MAAANRAELLSAVSKNDVDSLCEVTKKLFTDKTLEDTVVALNKRQRTELWDDILSLCMTTLLDSNNDDAEGAETLARMHRVLLCIARLATATLSSLGSLQRDDEDEEDGTNPGSEVEVPPSLHETAVILHGILPTLKSERGGIKNTVCLLFESWWSRGIQGKEELMANTVLSLLDRSTQADAAKVDVARVMALHKVLLAVDFSKDSAAPLVGFLLQCSYHPQYMSCPQGMQFLSFLLSLNPDLAQRLHDTIKVQLPSVPGAWGNTYGEIYFRAWQKSSEEQREYLELHCIQDFMHNACRLPMGARGSLWYTLFKILSSLHTKKAQRGVLDMLTRLYGPILWRSLMVCNSEVRLSAAHIMFDAFPLTSSALDCEEADKALQRQLDIMHSLLQDPVPAVRLAAVTGVGRVLSFYWELIPPDVIKCFMTTLVEDLAYDVTSPLVREAVIKVMQQLCGNHLALAFLAQILPTLRNFVHDTSERVRLAMMELLLKLKGVRSVKFYHVVPVEHLLARLEIDTSQPVVRRLMRLLYRSFVPTQETPQQQLERCKTLIMSNPGAARQFYLHLPNFLDTEDCVKYTVVLCRYLVESARQLNSHIEAQGSQDENDGNEKNSAESQETPESSQRSTRSRRSSAKKSRTSQGDHSVSSATKDNEPNEEDGEGDESRSESSQQRQQQLTDMLRGITEAIYLMYITLGPMLDASEEFRPLSEGLAKKLSVTVREMMAVSQDPELYNTLVALAGQLPSRALPMASQSLMNRLYRLKPGKAKENLVDVTCTVKALVQWGKANTLIEMVKESFDKKNESEEGLESGEKVGTSESSKGGEQKKKKKKTVGFSPAVEVSSVLPHEVAMQVMEVMLGQPECRPILLVRHAEILMSLARSLGDVTTTKLRDMLSPNAIESCTDNSMDVFTLPESDPSSVAMYVKLFELYLRLCAFLSCKVDKSAGVNSECVEAAASRDKEDEGRVRDEADRSLFTALTWNTTCLLPWLRATTVNADTESKAKASSKNRASKSKAGKSLKNKDFDTIPVKRRRVLLQLLVFSLKVTSSVMMAGRVSSSFLDEAIQLCVSVLQCLNSAGLHVLNPDLLAITLRCVYQLLSVRIKSDNGHDDSPQALLNEPREITSSSSSKEKCADVACSCLCLLFKALTDPHPASDNNAADPLMVENIQDTSASATRHSSDKSFAAGKTSCSENKVERAELIKCISPTVAELIVELTRPGRPKPVSQKTVSASLRCVLADVERACEVDGDLCDEEELKLPALGAAVIAAVKRRTGTLKMFCTELENCLSDTKVFNIFQARALLAIVESLRLCDPVLQTPAVYQAVRTKVMAASKPAAMDEDVFKDLQSKAESSLKRLRSELLSDS
ncbi:condensin-2 complex subunit G2-like [Elysia marginata]|uniref:Condensin-2 complex subunit G2-like n=1 Tax=Elysia marginata TaxID=1093978 RepID=A0AAV4FEX3_9GAST|nr:condensin-2 complex subunit G2-like [Elysia marginata]